MMRISKESSEKVVFWSFVFSVLVVVIHCAWRPTPGLERLSVAFFRDTLARMAVPFFFVCSGFFLAPHLEEKGGWRREVGKRIVSLGVPYVAWTLALAGVMLLELRVWMGLGGFGFDLTRMPALSPLWYVRSLMIFVVLSPLFKRAFDRFRFGSLAVAAFLYLAQFPLVRLLSLSDEGGLGGLLNFGFPAEGLLYFLGGIYIALNPGIRLSRMVAAAALVTGGVLVAVRLWTVQSGIVGWFDLRCLITPLTLIGLWGCLAPPALPKFLRGCAYPVYLMHAIVLFALRCRGGTYHGCNPWIEFALGLAVPIAFCNVVRRVWPRAAALLFGGRA